MLQIYAFISLHWNLLNQDILGPDDARNHVTFEINIYGTLPGRCTNDLGNYMIFHSKGAIGIFSLICLGSCQWRECLELAE